MNIFNELFFIVLSVQLLQCSNIYYKHVDEISGVNIDQFTWLVVIRDKNDQSMYKISYGTLIHSKAVLTSAQAIRGYVAENLTIEAKCQLNPEIDDKKIPYLINCKSKDVNKIIYQDKNSKKKYAILMLKERFQTADKVSIIDVATNLDNIDKQNCFIPRWMRIHDNSSGLKKLVTVQYNKYFKKKHFKPKFLDPEQLKTDTDYIIGKKFHELPDNASTISYECDGVEMSVSTNRINMLGSPFVCKVKGTSNYVQVGIVTYQFTINTFKFLMGTFNINRKGALFTIYRFQKKIMQTIIENIQVCKTVCQEYCSLDLN